MGGQWSRRSGDGAKEAVVMVPIRWFSAVIFVWSGCGLDHGAPDPGGVPGGEVGVAQGAQKKQACSSDAS